jgi:drug/metabolite transporter (DMT)-like permease
METGKTAQGIALVGASAVLWGMGGLFTRLLPFDLWTIVFWRGAFAVLFVGLYAWWRLGNGLAGQVRSMNADGALVCLCILGTITLFPAAFQHTSVAKAFMILSILPFVTAGIAWLWIGERPSGATLAASAVAMLGVLIMVGPLSGGLQTGDMLAAAGTLTQALATVAIRRNPKISMLPMVWLSQVLSVAVALPLAENLLALSPRDYLVAAGFALGPMTLGIAFYVAGSAMISTSLTALISVAEGPVGALWAWLGVGEAPGTPTLVGGAVVIAAVVGRLVLEEFRPGRGEPPH